MKTDSVTITIATGSSKEASGLLIKGEDVLGEEALGANIEANFALRSLNSAESSRF